VLDDGPQARKILLHSDPDTALPNVLVVMPVNASSAGHIGPWDLRIPLLHFGGKTP
jgi:hypothetical protein